MQNAGGIIMKNHEEKKEALTMMRDLACHVLGTERVIIIAGFPVGDGDHADVVVSSTNGKEGTKEILERVVEGIEGMELKN
jgi:hypothetical protein